MYHFLELSQLKETQLRGVPPVRRGDFLTTKGCEWMQHACGWGGVVVSYLYLMHAIDDLFLVSFVQMIA